MNPNCIWEEGEDSLWHTGCNNIHMFLDGSPTENTYKYCPYCGKTLEEVYEVNDETLEVLEVLAYKEISGGQS